MRARDCTSDKLHVAKRQNTRSSGTLGSLREASIFSWPFSCFLSASRRDIERKIEEKGEAEIRVRILSKEVKNSYRFRTHVSKSVFQKAVKSEGGTLTRGSCAQDFLFLLYESSFLFYTFYPNRRRKGLQK